MEGFSLLSHEKSAIAITGRLTGSQFRLWHYLLMIDPFADQTATGERIYHKIPSPIEIGIAIGSSTRTVEKDMRRLEKLKLYTKRVTEWQGYNLTAESGRKVSETMKATKASRAIPRKQQKSLEPLQDKGGYLAANPAISPEFRLFSRESGYLAGDEMAETVTEQQVQQFCVPDQTIQIFSEESRQESSLLKIFKDEEQPQPLATLEAASRSTENEPRISNDDQSSGAVGAVHFEPSETKRKLAALIGPLTAEDVRHPREERLRPISASYIEDVQDILIKHRDRLEKLGIDLSSEKLIETTNGHPHNLEPAIEAFLEKCSKGAIDHPERYLNAAIRDGYKPRNQSSTSIPNVVLTREFLQAYERMCHTGAVLSIHPEQLPVVSGQINIQMLRSDCKPWETPYDLMPWDKALSVLIANGKLADTSDDEW